MLLFIRVYVRFRKDITVSIHLMLLFIFFKCFFEDYFHGFQYISCYSLSGITDFDREECYCFNTSHVTLYQFQLKDVRDYIGVSIHLMLLFIVTLTAAMKGASVFQYISCYSLSVWLLPFSNRDNSFNTSHVTLYR